MATDHSILASISLGDHIIIDAEEGNVWIKKRDNENKDDYSLAQISPEFVRLNKKIFTKI